MKQNPSRRKFIQAGLMLPATRLVSSRSPEPFFPAPAGVVYRTLGKTGLKVSGVGCGAGAVPDPDILARAYDLGVNYFDTARDYGDSEKIFSGVIKGRQRDKIVIATKSPSRKKPDILRDLDTSLKELGTDYVDIWHLHGRDTPAWIRCFRNLPRLFIEPWAKRV